MTERTLDIVLDATMVNATCEGLFTDIYRPVLTRYEVCTSRRGEKGVLGDSGVGGCRYPFDTFRGFRWFDDY